MRSATNLSFVVIFVCKNEDEITSEPEVCRRNGTFFYKFTELSEQNFDGKSRKNLHFFDNKR